MGKRLDAESARKGLSVALGGVITMSGVQAAEMVKNTPALVLAAWFVGTMLGAFVAAKIGRSRLPAYIVGLFLVAFAVVTSILFPQPGWFTALKVIVVIAAPFAGMRMAGFGAPAAA